MLNFPSFATLIHWGKGNLKWASGEGSDLTFPVSLGMKSSQHMLGMKSIHPGSVP